MLSVTPLSERYPQALDQPVVRVVRASVGAVTLVAAFWIAPVVVDWSGPRRKTLLESVPAIVGLLT